MEKKRPIFTVDLEDYNDALHIPKNGHSSIESAWWILQKLFDHGIKATFFVLGKFAEEYPGIVSNIWEEGHNVLTHGQDHYPWEEADRKPYAWLGFTGGFYFRALPYEFVKRQIIANGFGYFHPHDFDEQHPKLANPIMNWKRHVGLSTARAKLERLLNEIEWDRP